VPCTGCFGSHRSPLNIGASTGVRFIPISLDRQEFDMKKLISIGLFAVLCGTAVAASAQDTTAKEGMTPKAGAATKDGMPMKEGMAPKEGMGKKMGTDMKAIDANGDGMISKDEFMKHHEAMFDKMKKGSNGMVSVKEMEAMHVGAMTTKP
jgi:EF hand